MLLIGLTGGIASGKSIVTDYISSKGNIVIDADLIARLIVEPGKPAWHLIKHEFGSSIINTDGTINREKLGDLVFRDREKRLLLNSITHPFINREIIRQLLCALFQFKPYVFLDLPLLFEFGRYIQYFYKIIVVSCSESQQIQRLMTRNNYTEEEARLRIAAQMPLAEKCRRADYIIDNSGSLENTYKQVDRVLDEINSSRAYWKYRFLLLFMLFNIILFTYVFYKRFMSFFN